MKRENKIESIVNDLDMFSSIIMTTSLLDIIVKIKHWNQFTTDISGPASILIYNNSTSPVSLVCNLSHNITSPIDLSKNSLSLNDYKIPFLWTSSRNFHYSLGLTLSWLQLTSLPSKQSLSLHIIPSHLFILHVFSKHGVPSHITSDRGLEFVSNFFYSLDITLDIQLHFTLGYYPKGDKQTEHTNQTIEQYCYIYYNYQQDNWSKPLSLTEFAYNNILSATTSVSLFFANK